MSERGAIRVRGGATAEEIAAVTVVVRSLLGTHADSPASPYAIWRAGRRAALRSTAPPHVGLPSEPR